jgi:exopolyphosphatase / guanosine-5'-triphosphate,3'-diphosphate pyrophosphatase
VGEESTGRGQAPLIAGVLDLGSNSVKLTVAAVGPGRGALEVLEERVAITRIGEGLDKNGRLQPAARARTLTELERMAEIVRRHRASVVRGVATAGLRGAADADEFLEEVRRRTGFAVELIGGLREAELAFRAPSAAFGPGPVVVIDLGGRSTELIAGSAGRIAEKISLEIGSVRVTERWLPSDPPRDIEIEEARRAIRELLQDAPNLASDGRLVGVSGTIVALLGLELGIWDADRLTTEGEGRSLGRAAVERSYQELRRVPASERLRGTILPAGRADVIIGGMLIVLEIFARYGRDEMGVTGRGVRYGLLHEIAEGT